MLRQVSEISTEIGNLTEKHSDKAIELQKKQIALLQSVVDIDTNVLGGCNQVSFIILLSFIFTIIDFFRLQRF